MKQIIFKINGMKIKYNMKQIINHMSVRLSRPVLSETRVVLVAAIFLFPLAGMAQTAEEESPAVDRNVTVERDFQPVIQDAGKITSLPEVLTVNVSKSAVDYSDFTTVLPFDKNFLRLSAAEVLHRRRRVANDAILRLGFGNYWNTLGELSLPILKTEKTRLDLMVNHQGTFGKKKHSLTGGSLAFNHFFPKYDFYAGMGLSHEFFNYYGDNFNLSGDTISLQETSRIMPNASYTERNLERITRTPRDVTLAELASAPVEDVIWRYNVYAGIRSLPNATGLIYSGELGYDLFSSHNGLQENIITARYGFNHEYGKNRFGMDFDLSNMIYRQNNQPAINFWDYYAVFSANPFFLMERDGWYLRAGLKTYFSFIHGKPFNPMPDVTAEWRVWPEYISVYAGVTGSYDVSTLSSVYAENPYVFSDLRVKDVYSPVRTFFGFKVKAMYNLLIDAFVDYKHINDQYFFVNKEYAISGATPADPDLQTIYTNRFNVIYSNADLFRIGLRANYNFRNMVNVQLKGTYNGWDVEGERFAWMKPAFETDLSADIKITRNLSTSANIYYEGVRYAKLGEEAYRMSPKVDINLGAAYAFNRSVSVFARVNNLINNKYQQFYGYDVQGLNFLIGGSVGF